MRHTAMVVAVPNDEGRRDTPTRAVDRVGVFRSRYTNLEVAAAAAAAAVSAAAAAAARGAVGRFGGIVLRHVSDRPQVAQP